ncbi:hypothetical protein [Nocardia grenadensis]|uniref:hypothetical protein n=1 Tax=Nocardia grenadensis TaxID=931537 RepID=UPI003D70A596
MAESCPFAPAVAFDDYENPVRTCLRYLVCPTGRAARAAVGRAIMRGRSATEYIAAAVTAPAIRYRPRPDRVRQPMVDEGGFVNY